MTLKLNIKYSSQPKRFEKVGHGIIMYEKDELEEGIIVI